MTTVKTFKGHYVPEGVVRALGSVFYKVGDGVLLCQSIGSPFDDWEESHWPDLESMDEEVGPKAVKLPQEPEQWMPEVGEEFEIAESTEYLTISHEEGLIVKVYASFTDDRNIDLFAFVTADGKHAGVCTAQCFRPIQTEREKIKAWVESKIDCVEDFQLDQAIMITKMLDLGCLVIPEDKQ